MKKPEILMTTNYDMFKLYSKNRTILTNRVNNIRESIEELDLTAYKPVIVNEKMEIVDGQTRFEACRASGLPIFYMKALLNGQTDKAIILMNAKQATWTLDEYIMHYVKKGVQDYIDILTCKERYSVTTSTAICFVANSSHNESDTIKSGKFKRGKIDYSVFGDMLLDFKEIFKNYNHVYFIRSLIYVVRHKFYVHKDDFKKFEKNRFKLKGCANVVQYLTMFEEILNHFRRGEKIKIMADYPKK